MKIIENQTFDMERTLYGSHNVLAKNCSFDGPTDGESAFKECSEIEAQNCFFNLRYPFWHTHGLKISASEMTELCRASLWYSDHIEITDTKMHGIKALRECSNVLIRDCDIRSPEFGWSVRGIRMEDTTAVSEYFMMRSENLTFHGVRFQGKYSFQYIKNAIFENCRIIGTQPFCYCKNLKLINCEMMDTDLCFEKSEVEACITTPVDSIKNPLSGHIYVPSVGEIIRDDADSQGKIIFCGQKAETAPACQDQSKPCMAIA